LIGAEIDPSGYSGDLGGTPVVGGCSDIDPHIPLARFEITGQVMEAVGAEVDFRVFPGMGHTINLEELAAARDLIAAVG
jgi:predicted esterase